MSTAQKVIKYLAIAFGIQLSVSIVSGIIMGVTFFFDILDYSDEITENSNDNELSFIADYEKEFEISEVKNLDIELDIAKFSIVKSDKLSITAYNLYENFKCDVENGTLIISENIDKNIKIFNDSKTPNITLYIPEDCKFGNVTIDSGVGTTDFEFLNTQNLDITFGAGNLQAENIISNETKFKGGVGELNITNSNLGKLDFKAGVGDAKIETELDNDSKIESGVGNITLTLLNEKEDYYFDIETGLGNITLDGEKVKNGTFGDKEAKDINIKGGIGNIKIKF